MLDRSASLAAILGLGFLASPAQADSPPLRIRIGTKASAEAVRVALEGARRKLEQPTCRQLFSEFHDAQGRPLQDGLDALAQTPEGYLGLVGFHDGTEARRCWNSRVLAITQPGHRNVWVCTAQFTDSVRRDPGHAETIVIHELLHTLGLGENPPTSAAISARVVERCGR